MLRQINADKDHMQLNLYTQQPALDSRFLTHSAVNWSDFNEIWNQADFQDLQSYLNFLNKLIVVTIHR